MENDILCQRKPFLVKGTCWPEWKLEWDLPNGVTADEVLARHSVPNLLERLEETLPLQVIEHRGMYNLGKRVQECTETSLLAALGEIGRRNLSELDAALSSDDVPIASHDFNLWRVSALPDQLVRHSRQMYLFFL
uniref:Riorf10 protein n=1 Tax=Rhizobium rhizogenes TaxID=359 RepID=Q9F5H7_RHIRH|nr:riorf10 [Rhizobium rhizogenes]